MSKYSRLILGLSLGLSLFLSFFMALSLRADEDSTYVEIAKLRKYASGADESDLKVQPELKQTQQNKKKKKTIKEPVEGF